MPNIVVRCRGAFLGWVGGLRQELVGIGGWWDDEWSGFDRVASVVQANWLAVGLW